MTLPLPSGLSGKPSQPIVILHWLLTEDVRLPKEWSGMVPITRGRFRVRFTARGMSTYTCWEDRDVRTPVTDTCHRFKPMKPTDRELTTSEYSTLMMLQSRMDGDTGGIFSILPSHVSVLPEGRGSPRRLDTSCLISFTFPLAKKVCVW